MGGRGGNPMTDWHPIQEGVKILLVNSGYQIPEIQAGLTGHLAHVQTHVIHGIFHGIPLKSVA